MTFKQHVIDSMMTALLREIVTQYLGDETANTYSKQQLVEYVRNEIFFDEEGLKDAIWDHWDAAKQSVIYDNEELYDREYRAIPMQAEMMINTTAIQMMIIDKLKRLVVWGYGPH